MPHLARRDTLPPLFVRNLRLGATEHVIGRGIERRWIVREETEHSDFVERLRCPGPLSDSFLLPYRLPRIQITHQGNQVVNP